MLEAFMLILLGVLIMALISLALAPLLWSRAARITTQRVQQDVHSTAFSEASQHVSKRYEGKIAERESALRAEIAQLEASRESISAEASNRVSNLEQTRARLEQDIAARDAQLAESQRLFQELAQSVRSLSDRADMLDRAHHEIAAPSHAPDDQQPATAQAVSHQMAPEPDPNYEPEPGYEPEPTHEAPSAVQHEPVTEQSAPAVAQTQDEQNDAETPAPAQAARETPAMPDLPRETTLSDRIRALRNGVSA